MNESFEKAVDIFHRHNGLLRTAQAKKLGIDPKTLSRMAASRILVKEGRGIYRLSSLPPLSKPDFVLVTMRVPHSVICLISALSFHSLTTQLPYKVYIAIPQNVKKPRIDYPPISVVKLSKKVYESGIEEHIMDGERVSIYNKEKTVADCFKFRNKIGQDIAIEALKDYLNGPGSSAERLMHYARVNRVHRLIKPYIEAII